MKSSLKTFLAGKNKLEVYKLKEALTLEGVIDDETPGSFYNNGYWYIDVLDDGTAITYRNH